MRTRSVASSSKYAASEMDAAEAPGGIAAGEEFAATTGVEAYVDNAAAAACADSDVVEDSVATVGAVVYFGYNVAAEPYEGSVGKIVDRVARCTAGGTAG